ncbi:hypothetical protein AK88_01309 [Plasmodium fragile]|uniref:Zinc finger PHD-type domain-containing protein n=1 Tax=Plasmodium fragile TaxID=5857 RepID=A0A0D9QQE0_PLAFR|nr:uncharacterized protein AK88_01309 [Plasmodium fragile]KJP89017.1 hypothetical protein AK88_01309 [Plasmodium fragile]
MSSVQGSSVHTVLCRNKMKVVFDHGVTCGGVIKGTTQMDKTQNAEWDVQNYACHVPVKNGPCFGHNAKVFLLVMRHLYKTHDHQDAIHGAMKKTNFFSNMKCAVLLLLVLYKNRKKASLVAHLAVNSGSPRGVLSHGEHTYNTGAACGHDGAEQAAERGSDGDDETGIYLDVHSTGRTASPPTPKKNILFLKRSGHSAMFPFCKNVNCVKVKKKKGYHNRFKRKGNVHANFHRTSSFKWSCRSPNASDLTESEQLLHSAHLHPLAETKNCSMRRITIVKTSLANVHLPTRRSIPSTSVNHKKTSNKCKVSSLWRSRDLRCARHACQGNKGIIRSCTPINVLNDCKDNETKVLCPHMNSNNISEAAYNTNDGVILSRYSLFHVNGYDPQITPKCEALIFKAKECRNVVGNKKIFVTVGKGHMINSCGKANWCRGESRLEKTPLLYLHMINWVAANRVAIMGLIAEGIFCDVITLLFQVTIITVARMAAVMGVIVFSVAIALSEILIYTQLCAHMMASLLEKRPPLIIRQSKCSEATTPSQRCMSTHKCNIYNLSLKHCTTGPVTSSHSTRALISFSSSTLSKKECDIWKVGCPSVESSPSCNLQAAENKSLLAVHVGGEHHGGLNITAVDIPRDRIKQPACIFCPPCNATNEFWKRHQCLMFAACLPIVHVCDRSENRKSRHRPSGHAALPFFPLMTSSSDYFCPYSNEAINATRTCFTYRLCFVCIPLREFSSCYEFHHVLIFHNAQLFKGVCLMLAELIIALFFVIHVMSVRLCTSMIAILNEEGDARLSMFFLNKKASTRVLTCVVSSRFIHLLDKYFKAHLRASLIFYLNGAGTFGRKNDTKNCSNKDCDYATTELFRCLYYYAPMMIARFLFNSGMSNTFCVSSDEDEISENTDTPTLLSIVGKPRTGHNHLWKYNLGRGDPHVCSNPVGDSEWGGNNNDGADGGDCPTAGNSNEGGNHPQEVNNNLNGNGNQGGDTGDKDDRDGNDNNEDQGGGFPEGEEQDENVLMDAQNGKTKKKRKKTLNDKSRNINKATTGRKSRTKTDTPNDKQDENNMAAGNYGSVHNMKQLHKFGGMNSVAGVNNMGSMHNGSFLYNNQVSDKIMHDGMGKMTMKSGGGYPSRMGGDANFQMGGHVGGHVGAHSGGHAVGQMHNGNMNMYLNNTGSMQYMPPYANSNNPVGMSLSSGVAGSANGSLGNHANSSGQGSSSMHGQMKHLNSGFRNSVMKNNSSQMSRMMISPLSPQLAHSGVNSGVHSAVNSGAGNNMGNYGMHFNQQQGSIANGHVGNKVSYHMNGQTGVGCAVQSGMSNAGSNSFVHHPNNHIGSVPNSLSSSVSSSANMHMEDSNASGSNHKGHMNVHPRGNTRSTCSMSSQLGGLQGGKPGAHINGPMHSAGSGHMSNQMGAHAMSQTSGPLMSQTSGPLMSQTSGPLMSQTSGPLMSQTSGPLMSQTSGSLMSQTSAHSNKVLTNAISMNKLNNSKNTKSGNASLSMNSHMMNPMASYMGPNMGSNMGRNSVTKNITGNTQDGMNNGKMQDTVMNSSVYRSNSLLRDTLMGSNKAGPGGAMQNQMMKNAMMKNEMRNNSTYMVGMVNDNLVHTNMGMGVRGSFRPMNSLPVYNNGTAMKFAGQRYSMSTMVPNSTGPTAAAAAAAGGMMMMNREMNEMGSTPGMMNYISGNNFINKNMKGVKMEHTYPFEQMNMRNDQLHHVEVHQTNMGHMSVNNSKMYLSNVQVGNDKISGGNFLQGESNQFYSYGSGPNDTCGGTVHKSDMNGVANANVCGTTKDVGSVSSNKQNTVLNSKKKSKNNLKNGREHEMNNSQNLRTVKINWSKYDSIFKKIKLEKDYEKFINTDKEDAEKKRKNNMSDADTDDKSDWEQNPAPGFNDLLNINFRSFIHDYNEILNKLNSIRVNDKSEFKKNAYTQLYEEIFLNIERFFDISQLRHENNFTHSNFYKNTLDRVSEGDMLLANGSGSDGYEGAGVTSTEVAVVNQNAASASVGNLAHKTGKAKVNRGVKSQCTDPEKGTHTHDGEDDIMNKGKTNFFQSVSRSAGNNSLFEMLLKKKKEFDEICMLHNFDSAMANGEVAFPNDTSGRNVTPMDRSLASVEKKFTSSSFQGSPAKNKMGTSVPDYKTGVTHVGSGNVRYPHENNPGTNKKGGSEIKNAAYQNHFIEKILSKRYRTYSINEFVNVQLNDNLLELIDMYKQNLCFNIRKMLKKKISHERKGRFDWHYGVKRVSRIGRKTRTGKRRELLTGRGKKKKKKIMGKGKEFPSTTLKMMGMINSSDELACAEAARSTHLGDHHPVTEGKNASGENLEKPLFFFSSGNFRKRKKNDQDGSANVGDGIGTEEGERRNVEELSPGRKCEEEQRKDGGGGDANDNVDAGINKFVNKLSFGLFQTKLKSPQKNEGEMKNRSDSTVDHCTMENHGDISLYIEKNVTQKKSPRTSAAFMLASKMECTNLSISRMQKRLFDERRKIKLNKQRKMRNLKYKTNAIIDFGDKIVWVSFEFNHLDTLRKIKNNFFNLYNLSQLEKTKDSDINLEKCITNEMKKYKNVKIRFYKFLSYYDFVFLKNRLNFIKIKYKNGVARTARGMTFPGTSLAKLADMQRDHPAEITSVKMPAGGAIVSDPTVGNVKCEAVQNRDKDDSSPQDGPSVEQAKSGAVLSDVHPGAELVKKDHPQTGALFSEKGIIKGGEVNSGNNNPVLKSEGGEEAQHHDQQEPLTKEQLPTPLHNSPSIIVKSEHPKSEVIYPYLPFAKTRGDDINQILNDVKNLYIEPNDHMIKKNKLRKDITLFPLIDKKRLNTYISLDLNAAAKEELVKNEHTNNHSVDKEIHILNKFLSTNLKLEKMEFGKVGSGINTSGGGAATTGAATGGGAVGPGIIIENYDHARNNHMHCEKYNTANSVLIDNYVWSNNPSLFSIFEKYYLLLKMQKYILQYKHFSKNSLKRKLSSESNCDVYSSSNSLKGSSSGNVKGRRRYGKGGKGTKKGGGGRRLSSSKGGRRGVAAMMASANDGMAVDTVGVKRRRKAAVVTTSQPCKDVSDQVGFAKNDMNEHGLVSGETNEHLAATPFVKVEPEGASTCVDSIQNEGGGEVQGMSAQRYNTPIGGTGTNGSVEVPPEQIDALYPAMKNKVEEEANAMGRSGVSDEVQVANGEAVPQDANTINEQSVRRTCKSESNSSGSVKSAKRNKSSLQTNVAKGEMNFIGVVKDGDAVGDSDAEAEFDTELEDGSGKKRRGRKKGKKRGRKKGGRNKYKLEEDNMTVAESNRTMWKKQNGEYEKYQLKDSKKFTDLINNEDMLDEMDKEILANEVIPIDKDIIIDLLCEEEKLIESYIKNSKFVDKNLICFLIYLNTVQKRLSCISNKLLKKVIRENKMPARISENVSRSDEITYRYLMFERWNQLRYSVFYNMNYVRSGGSRVMLHDSAQSDGYKNVNIQTIFDLHKFSGKYKKQKLPPFEYSMFLKYKIHKQSKTCASGQEGGERGGECSPGGEHTEGVEEMEDEETVFMNNEDNFCGFSNNTDLNITPVLSYCCVCFNDDYNTTQISEQGDPVQNVSRNNSISNSAVDVKSESMDKTQQGQGRSRSNSKRDEVGASGELKKDGDQKGAQEATQPPQEGTLRSMGGSQINNPSGECEKKINSTCSGTDTAIIEKNIKSNRNLMMRCGRCYMHVHKFCYISTKRTEESSSTYAQATTSISSNEWLCQRCEFEKKTLGNNYLYLFDNHVKCYICIERGGAFIQLRSDIFVHTFCAMFCVPDLLVNANVNLENVEEFLKLNNVSLTQEILSSLERKRRKLLLSGDRAKKGLAQDGLPSVTGNSNLMDPCTESSPHPSAVNSPVSNNPAHVAKGSDEKTADCVNLEKNEEAKGNTASGEADGGGDPNPEADTEYGFRIKSIRSIFSKSYFSSPKHSDKKNAHATSGNDKVGDFPPSEQKEDKKKRGSENVSQVENLKKKKKTAGSVNDEVNTLHSDKGGTNDTLETDGDVAKGSAAPGEDKGKGNNRAHRVEQGDDGMRSGFDHSKDTDLAHGKQDGVRIQCGERYLHDGYSSSESSSSILTASSIRSDSTLLPQHDAKKAEEGDHDGEATLHRAGTTQKEKNIPTKQLSCIRYLLNGYGQDTVRCDVCLKSKGIFIKCENIKCDKYVHPLCAYMCGLYIRCKNSNKKFLKFQNKIDYCFPRIFFFIKCISHSIKKCGVIRIYEEIIKRRTKYLNRDLYPSIYESNKKERKQKNSVKYKIKNNCSNIKKGGSMAGGVGNGPAAIAAIAAVAAGGPGGGTGDIYEVLAFNFNYLDSYQYNFFLLPSIDYIKNDICLVCFTSYKKKELLYCKYCNMCVHKSCYLVDSTYLEYHFYRKNKRAHTFLMHTKQQKLKNLLSRVKERKEALLNALLQENNQHAYDDVSQGGVTGIVKEDGTTCGEIIPRHGMIDLPPQEGTSSGDPCGVKGVHVEEQLLEMHNHPSVEKSHVDIPPVSNHIIAPEGGEPNCAEQSGVAPPGEGSAGHWQQHPHNGKGMNREKEMEKSKLFKELMQNEVITCLYTPEYLQSTDFINKLKEFKKKQNVMQLSENVKYKCEEEKCLTDLDDVEERKLFVCDLCANNYNHENVNCILCSRRGGAIKLIKVNDHNKVDKNKNKKNAFLKSEKDFVFVHMQCALYAPQIIIQDIGEEYYQMFNYDNYSMQECDEVSQMKDKGFKSDTEVCVLNKECDYDEKQNLLGEFLYRHAAAPTVNNNKGKNARRVLDRKNSATSACVAANVVVGGAVAVASTIHATPAQHTLAQQGVAVEVVAAAGGSIQIKEETNAAGGLVGKVVPPVSCNVRQPNEIGKLAEGEGDAKVKKSLSFDIEKGGADGAMALTENGLQNTALNAEQCGERLVKEEGAHPTEANNLMSIAQQCPNGTTNNNAILNETSNTAAIPNTILNVTDNSAASNNAILNVRDKYGRRLKKGKEILSYNKSNSMMGGDPKKRQIVPSSTHVPFSNKKTSNLYYYNFNRKKNNYKIIIKDKLKKHLNKNVCYICNLTYGYTQKCVENNCNNYFHISCAKIHKHFFEFDYTFLKIFPNVMSMQQMSKLSSCSVGTIIFCEAHSRIRRKVNPSIKLFSKLRSFLELARIIVGQMKKREDIKNAWIKEKHQRDITSFEHTEEDVDNPDEGQDPEEVDDVDSSISMSDSDGAEDGGDDDSDEEDDDDFSEEEEEGSMMSGSARGVSRNVLYAPQTDGEANMIFPRTHTNQFDEGGAGGDRGRRLPSDALAMMQDSAPGSSDNIGRHSSSRGSSSRSGLSHRSNNTKRGHAKTLTKHQHVEDQLQMKGLHDHHKLSMQSEYTEVANGERGKETGSAQSNEPMEEEMEDLQEDVVDKVGSDKDEDYVPEDEAEDS